MLYTQGSGDPTASLSLEDKFLMAPVKSSFKNRDMICSFRKT